MSHTTYPHARMQAHLAQPPSHSLQCNKLLGDTVPPRQPQPLQQNKQPRHQAAYQLCTPAGASYSSLTAAQAACRPGALPSLAAAATTATAAATAATAGSGLAAPLLLVVSNCQAVVALGLELSGGPPPPASASVHPPLASPSSQSSVHSNPLFDVDISAADGQAAERPPLAQAQPGAGLQQQGPPAAQQRSTASPVDLDAVDVVALSPQEQEGLLLGLPQVPLGSSLLAFAAAKRQQQQQQQAMEHGAGKCDFLSGCRLFPLACICGGVLVLVFAPGGALLALCAC